MRFTFEGVLPAVWTPTDARGELIADDLRRNMEFVRAATPAAWMALGSTGEFVHLTLDQRKQTLERIIEFSGGLPVVANISATTPRDAIALGKHARSVGAVAIAALPPWFFRIADDDLTAYFTQVAEGVGLPLLLYNFPEMTGNMISPEVASQVAERVPVAALKFSGYELARHADYIAVARAKNFRVLTGWDKRIPEAMALGASGCIGGMANYVPELMVEAFHAMRAGDSVRADAAAAKLVRLSDTSDAVKFPLNVAAAMEARGLHPGVPKMALSAKTRAAYDELKARMRALCLEMNLPLAH